MSEDTDWGIIFDIKRFALHDGDGIRSTLFTKGCPLRCPWCHNPEGQRLNIELMWFETLCIGCGRCLEACPHGALSRGETGIKIDRDKCRHCGTCIEVCPALALKFDGRKIHYEEAVRELMKDKVFFMESGGGVTISGGDPLVQSEFNLKVLQRCKEEEVHTIIETCLYASTDLVQRFAKAVDKFYIDIKLFDDRRHLETVGVSNKKILENFEALSVEGADICVRIPLIPGFTADDANICAVAEYVAKVNPQATLELLNYNPLAKNKYDSLQEKYLVSESAQTVQ